MNLRSLLVGSILVGGLLTANANGPIVVTQSSPTVTEDFNSAPREGSAPASSALPEGWRIDVNRDKTRTIRTWEGAESQIASENTKGCFVGPNLASNEKNGPYYFYETNNTTDYAVGGITTGTGTANGADCITLMAALTNGDQAPIDRVNISYAIEKYRKGNNAQGWEVSLYYSLDGSTWNPAGNDFKNIYSKDDATAGVEIVPILTDKVDNKTLMVDVNPGQTLYLGWMMTVAAGTEGSGAQVFGIDDVELKVGFADADAHNIYIENATGRTLSVYSPANTDFYGEAPGLTSSTTKTINGVTYYVWPVIKAQNAYSINVMAGGQLVGSENVSLTADNYFCASPQGLSVISNPENYEGWVDPNRPPFVSSGIFIRGEINSWGSPAEWEFSNEGNGTYVLYDKTLSGMFKVADANWSSACNYGSNGSNVMIDEPYALVSGTDTNISTGNNTFTCSRIVLTIVNGNATLLLESDDNEAGLTSVYMVGDFNSWNYMSTTGELKLDDADGLFKGRVSMTAGDNGLSNWMIYLRLGKSGAYGLAQNATASTLTGTLVKGETGTAAVAPGTYDVTFNLNDGSYTLNEVESAPSVLELNPANTVLVPENPATIKVLSLNNSLIHYNDQARMFNEIAQSMGKDASWTKHTNLGKTLQYHWEEGEGLTADGMPGAKMMVRSDAWSHIILQEQTALPRTSFEQFRNSVKQWVEYIRENCPNPNAVIILPMNWHYAQDWSNFDVNNHLLMDAYTNIAKEFGVVVCPVAVAYQAKYEKDGGAATEAEWFLPGDDRHPTIRGTYMAALMEYGLIFNEDPTTVSFWPDYTTEYDSKKIDASIAAEMREYAKNALNDYENIVNHHAGTVKFDSAVYDDFGIPVTGMNVTYTVDGGGSMNGSVFTSDGTRGSFTVTATAGDFSKTAVVTVADANTEVITYPSVTINVDNATVSQNFDTIGLDAEAKLPEGWRIDRQTSSPRTVGTFAVASENTMYAGGTSLPSNAKNGTWNFGADNSSDRAVGGITTGVDNGSRAINVYTHLYNDGKKSFESLNISYDVEKYRKGANAAGFAVQMYYSLDGNNWTSAGDNFRTFFESDGVTEGYTQVPGDTRSVEASLPVMLGGGMDLYLAWNISVASGSDAQGAMALALDNVTIEGVLPTVPVKKHYIYVDNQTSWDALGLYAWGESELFGAWPGQAPFDEKVEDGVTYQVFGHDADTGSFNLIFNNWNQGKQLNDYNVSDHSVDYYFQINDNEVKLVKTSSVENIIADTPILSLVGKTVSSTIDTAFNVYSLQGVNLTSAYGRSIDLSKLGAGVFIVSATSQAGTSVMKVNLR